MNKRTLLRHLRHIFCIVLLFHYSAYSYAQNLAIVELKYRPADQVIPVLNSLFNNRATISGQGFKLFVRADAATLRDLKQVLENLDSPQRQLRIAVRQSEDIARSRVEISGAAVLKPGGSTVSAGARSNTTQSHDSVNQYVQGLEGAPVFISVGEQRLLPGALVNQTRNSTVIIPSAQPVEANTGFYVLPRVQGDNVNLEISTQREAFGTANAIKSQAITSQARGRLGEWIDLGGVEASGSRWRVQVLVEELK